MFGTDEPARNDSHVLTLQGPCRLLYRKLLGLRSYPSSSDLILDMHQQAKAVCQAPCHAVWPAVKPEIAASIVINMEASCLEVSKLAQSIDIFEQASKSTGPGRAH